MERTIEGWDRSEWDAWQAKLEELSVEQLARLTKDVGISFGDKKPTAKEAYILVLDEADPNLLKQKYDAVRRA